jgi:hypothetical protein
MKRVYILLAGIAAAAVMAAPASAATSTVTGTISAGTPSIVPSASAAFGLTPRRHQPDRDLRGANHGYGRDRQR